MAKIFCYGTLMNPQTRKLTGQSGTSTPSLIHGFRRGWTVRVESLGMFAVGVVEDKDAHCIGMVVDFPDSEISKFDKREIDYRREKLDLVKRDYDEKTQRMTAAAHYNVMSKFDNGYKIAGQKSDKKMKKDSLNS